MPDFIEDALTDAEELLMRSAAGVMSPGLAYSPHDLWRTEISRRMTTSAFNLVLWRLTQRGFLRLHQNGTYMVGDRGWEWINDNLPREMLALRGLAARGE